MTMNPVAGEEASDSETEPTREAQAGRPPDRTIGTRQTHKGLFFTATSERDLEGCYLK